MPHRSGPGAIFGVVSEDGIAKPGQRVVLFDRDTNQVLDSRVADADGRYLFSGLDSSVSSTTSPYTIFALDNDDSTFKNAVIHDLVVPVNAATGTTFSGNFYKYACIDRAPAYLFLPKNNGVTGASRVFTANYRGAFGTQFIYAGAITEDLTSTPGAPHIPSINLTAAAIIIPRSHTSSQNYSLAAHYSSGKWMTFLAVFDVTGGFQMMEDHAAPGGGGFFTGSGILWDAASSTMCFNSQLNVTGVRQVRFNMSAKLGTAVTSFEPTGNTVELVAHGFLDGEQVCFTNSTGTGLPTGLVSTTKYYVVNKTDDDFQIEATIGGGAVNFSGTGSGTSYVTKHYVRAFVVAMYLSSTDTDAQMCYVDDPTTLSDVTGIAGTLTVATMDANSVDQDSSSERIWIGDGYAKSVTSTPGVRDIAVTAYRVGPVAIWMYAFTASQATELMNSLMKDETEIGFSTAPQFSGYVREVLADSPSNFIRPGVGYNDSTTYRQLPFFNSAVSAVDPDSTHYISETSYTSGAHITVSGTTPTVSGAALDFPGGASTTPYLSWPYAAGCASKRYMTLTFWLKVPNLSAATVSGKYGIMKLPGFKVGYTGNAGGTNPATGSPNCAVFLNSTGVSTVGAATFGITLNNSAFTTAVTNTYVMTGAVIPDTSWHHYAFVVDTYSANLVSFYKDGVYVTSTASTMVLVGTLDTPGNINSTYIPSGMQTTNTRAWLLGTAGDSTLSAYNLTCSIGDTALYASALSAERLLAHYNAASSP